MSPAVEADQRALLHERREARDDAAVQDPEFIDLKEHFSALQTGTNVLAIQGLNVTAADANLHEDGDFLWLAQDPDMPDPPEQEGRQLRAAEEAEEAEEAPVSP